jgi:signal transduction histidine kinase
MALDDLRRHVPRLSARAVDATVVAGVAVAIALTIAVAEEPDATRSPDALAYLLGLCVALLLLGRRRWPLPVLIGSIGLLLLYYSLDYPAFSPAVPLAAAAYATAVAGRLLPAATLLAGTLLLGASWQTIGERSSALSVLGQGTLTDASLLAAVLLLGEAVRNRRAHAAEVQQRLARTAREQERAAERRVEQERLRIARELHDVTAHTISALSVQAAVAADLLDSAPEQARASLTTIREHSRTAMAELRATVGLLRAGEEDAPRAPAPGLAALDALVETSAAAGIAVDVTTTGAVRPLPGAADLTAFRIVQESLTNVVRHATATRARVEIDYGADAVVVQVTDDGRGAAAPAGFGLTGMRERAAALGGTLVAGPLDGGGFRVRADLPTERAAA